MDSLQTKLNYWVVIAVIYKSILDTEIVIQIYFKSSTDLYKNREK